MLQPFNIALLHVLMGIGNILVVTRHLADIDHPITFGGINNTLEDFIARTHKMPAKRKWKFDNGMVDRYIEKTGVGEGEMVARLKMGCLPLRTVFGG